MRTIYINPKGGNLSMKAIFLGKMVANYEMILREKNTNGQTSLLNGDNTNPEDDRVNLPLAAAEYVGKKLVLETGFYGLDAEVYPDYEIRAEIYQDGVRIGVAADNGKLNGKGQYSLIYLLLQSDITV